VNKTT